MQAQHIIQFLDTLYPSELAMDWDHVGLQIGAATSISQRIGVALTLTPAILETVIARSIQLVIVHHPVFFHPIHKIDLGTCVGQTIKTLLQNEVTVFAIHTNLDVAHQGVSDVLADRFGIHKPIVLQPTGEQKCYKLVTYVPEADFELFRENFLQSRVGHMGNYSHCSFASRGEGTFKPLPGAEPYIGNVGCFETVAEQRVETIVDHRHLAEAISDLQHYHPYEEVAYDVIPLWNHGDTVGFGRYGSIEACELGKLIFPILGSLKGFRHPEKVIRRVGVCGGNGAKFIQQAIDLNLDLFVSSEFGYHDELLADDHGMTLLDIGHEASETPMMQTLTNTLQKTFGNDVESIEFV